MSSVYVSYDIKGIQQFILRVPRLKCMIGASGQIANFDAEFESELATKPGVEYVFSGGGRGAIRCVSDKIAKGVKDELIAQAHKLGLDIRIGIHEDFSTAVKHADELYPFCPEQMKGFPCSASGLFPVAENSDSTVHDVIRARIREANRDRDYLWKDLYESVKDRMPSIFRDQDYTVEFLRNVNPEPSEFDDDEIDQRRARAGQISLGRRNRWAIVAMDGNDMGQQFDQLLKLYPETIADKLRIVSDELKRITREAFEEAFLAALRLWLNVSKPHLQNCSYEERGLRYLVLPFRPLILGGDDLVLLCHSSLAMEFVRTLAREFAVRSKTASDRILNENGFQPFPATNGRLAISAGVLYSKVTLPLHTAIPYAEGLLANAKAGFRKNARGTAAASTQAQNTTSEPTPAAVDWDCITDTMIDTPALRRQRELQFLDDETKRLVSLTDRPYLLDTGLPDQRREKRGNNERQLAAVLHKAEALRTLPNSFRTDLKSTLNQVWSERMRFLISVSKDQSCRDIVDSLWERDDSQWAEDGARDKRGFGWRVETDEKTKQKKQYTDLLDAVLLLDEDHRMSQELET